MAYIFTKDTLKDSLSYTSYRELIDKLLLEGKTTGSNQGADMVEYTKLNIQRMNRNDKTTVIDDNLKSLAVDEQHWVLLSEAWCGDAANIVPVIAKMAESLDKVHLHILLRDDNPHIMDEYLTNGARSIPLLIVLDKNYNELFVWGPRPEELQNIVVEFKKKPDFDIEELKKNLQMWYVNDKSLSSQKEIIKKLKDSI